MCYKYIRRGVACETNTLHLWIQFHGALHACNVHITVYDVTTWRWVNLVNPLYWGIASTSIDHKAQIWGARSSCINLPTGSETRAVVTRIRAMQPSDNERCPIITLDACIEWQFWVYEYINKLLTLERLNKRYIYACIYEITRVLSSQRRVSTAYVRVPRWSSNQG